MHILPGSMGHPILKLTYLNSDFKSMQRALHSWIIAMACRLYFISIPCPRFDKAVALGYLKCNGWTPCSIIYFSLKLWMLTFESISGSDEVSYQTKPMPVSFVETFGRFKMRVVSSHSYIRGKLYLGHQLLAIHLRVVRSVNADYWISLLSDCTRKPYGLTILNLILTLGCL